jgi:hypothetical protein
MKISLIFLLSFLMVRSFVIAEDKIDEQENYGSHQDVQLPQVELEKLDVSGHQVEEVYDDPESLELMKLLKQNQSAGKQFEKKGRQYQQLGTVIDRLSLHHKQYAVQKWDYEGKVEVVNKQLECAQQKEKAKSPECRSFFEQSQGEQHSSQKNMVLEEDAKKKMEEDREKRKKQEMSLEYASMIYRTLEQDHRLADVCARSLSSARSSDKQLTDQERKRVNGKKVEFMAIYRIDQKGKVHQIRIQSPFVEQQQPLQQCVSWVLLQTRFSPPPFGEEIVIRQPVVLDLKN